MSYKLAQLEHNHFKYVVRQKGGHLPESPGFWGNLGRVDDSVSNKEQESADDSNDLSSTNHHASKTHSDLPMNYHCPEDGCVALYKTQLGLENHLILEQHRFPKQVETITDRGIGKFWIRIYVFFSALKVFTKSIERNRVVFERVPVNLIDLEKSINNVKAGFALYSKERSTHQK